MNKKQLNAEWIDEWIDNMSKIGCLCIKYEYLRDLFLKYKQQKLQFKQSTTENLASEPRWLSFCRTHSNKFKYKYSYGLYEHEYFSIWLDEDIWHMFYYNFIKTEHPIESSEALWTVDIFSFPYKSL